ncbi:dynamin gtpase [Diplodia corticola]|uniref:Dynamin gtpase n=1 Tax=Diplodia corticola TaxID=236234 RepID=A0A1J9RW36_9PEZI|nr:dynamin gtpase [Diplodia corticola]OJD32591.1 dynamin gtpase [Diplodia corticola]
MGASENPIGPMPRCTTFPSATELHSAKSTHRLNQIDRVRASGIGDHIPLPQLVVCGDQSSGKSSVLQGITGIPFPRKDGLCTRFATEIILRHDSTKEQVCATVIPHDSRSEIEKQDICRYRRELHDFEQLPIVIEEAIKLMQLRGAEGVNKGPSFSADILRIEVVGKTGLHLTIVDLPGLISVSNDEQTEEDVEIVSDLVNTYLESSRTIILAVVQANNDIANQGIIQRARKFDPQGQRTVGIITKPDLINHGTEGRIAALARNEDTTKLKLGFFLLKNPSPLDLDTGLGADERRRRELAFFAASPWKEQHLDPGRVGADALSAFLQNLLDAHIERELPKVRREVEALLAQTEQDLEAMGQERSNVGHLRMFLTSFSMKFMGLTQAALDGNYLELERDLSTKDDLLDVSYRLRAQSHILNGGFSENLRLHGQKRSFIGKHAQPMKDEKNIGSKQAEFDSWIREVYTRTRGRELPGNYNHLLLAELFQELSSPWESIARKHVGEVNDLVQRFVSKVLDKIVSEESVRAELHQYVSDELERRAQEAEKELGKILADERREPMTYNHYYTDNIQKSRQCSMRNSVQATMKDVISKDWGGVVHLTNTEYDRNELLDSLGKRVVVDMDAQACEEARVGLEAYYKVARKTFADNVCRQVVERHILSKLPHIFSPTVVIGFSDEDLVRVASEPQIRKERRQRLAKLAQGLGESLRGLRK